MRACLRPAHLLLALALLSHEATAFAESRVVVLPFSGPRAGAARAAVVRALEGEHTLVAAGEWRAAVERSGAPARDANGYARAAREARVTAIVVGRVQRSGRRRFAVAVVVRQGLDGEIVGRASRVAPNLPGIGGAAAGLRARILELVAAATPPEPDGAGGPGDDGGTVIDWSGEAVVDEVPPGAGRPQEVDGERPAGEVDVTSGVAGEAATGGGGRAATAGWLEICLDFGLSSRSFSLSIDAARDQQTRPIGMNGRPGVELGSGVYVEMGARAFVYPLALLSDAWWSGFGLELSFHHDLSLTVARVDELGRQVGEIETREYTLTAGALYRHVIGTSARGVTLTGGVGYGRFSFLVGPQGNDLVAPFDYDYLFVGASAYVPAMTRHAGVDLGVRYNGVVSIGGEAARAYSGDGESPSSHGFALLAGASGQLWRGLRWRAAFELLGFVTTHAGVGRGYGDDPSTRAEVLPDGTIVGGIETTAPTVDLFWRILLQLSYRFAVADRPAGGSTRGDGGRGSEPEGGREEVRPEPEPERDEDAADDDGWFTTE